jgi:hypothetical protein
MEDIEPPHDAGARFMQATYLGVRRTSVNYLERRSYQSVGRL